jgi:arylsulfatase A-like enzyme
MVIVMLEWLRKPWGIGSECSGGVWVVVIAAVEVIPRKKQVEEACQWYVRAARYLTEHYPWDVLAVQLHVQDGINHVLAREVCPEAPEYTLERSARAWASFEASYKAVDRMVDGILKQCADEQTLVVVLSDHGAIPTLRRCSVAGALVRAGLLAYRHDSSAGQWSVDWSRSKVFPRRTHIWVNLRGRDPQGIVPADEFEAVRTAAIAALHGIRDPVSGEAPVEIVLRKEDASILGLWGEVVGDLMFWMKPTYTDADLDYNALAEDPATSPDVGSTQVGCAHHQYLPSARFGVWNNAGIFFMRGPGIRGGYARPTPMWQVDVVPTVCYLLGLRPPRNAEGRIVWDVLAGPDL